MNGYNSSFQLYTMIKIMLYEDNPQLREGLTMLIDGSEGYQVLASFKNC